MSLDKLSFLTGIEMRRLTRIENGEVDPQYSEVVKIDAALSSDKGTFLSGVKAKRRPYDVARRLEARFLDISIPTAHAELSYLITTWHNMAGKGPKEDNYFCRFFLEYLAFLAQLRILFRNKFETERDLIQAFKREDGIENKDFKNRYLNLVAKPELGDIWSKVISKLDNEPLKDDTQHKNYWNFSGKTNQKPTVPMQNDGKVASCSDWINMIEYWYRVRNNLFHAKKDPDSERDKFLVEYAFKTLQDLVTIIIAAQ